MGEVKVIGKRIPAINAPRYPKLPRLPSNISRIPKYIRRIATMMDIPNKVKFGYLMRSFMLPINGISTFKTSKGLLNVAHRYKI